MVQAIRQKVTVQKDSIIEIHSPILKPGTHVEVILLIEEKKPTLKRNLSDFLGTGKGSFATPKEADIFIREERNKWE